MSGLSEQEQAAKSLYAESNLLPSEISNRWAGFNPSFNYDKMAGNLEDIFNNYQGIINRDTAGQIAEQQSDAGSSLASRGITGGSVLADTQSKIASDINKSKTNALANLGINKTASYNDLMKYFNQLDILKTQGATDVDRFNLGAKYNKFGLKSGALQGLSDDTWLDDLFAGLTAGGQLAQGIGSIIKPSDIRFKENIEKIAEKNGINIYRYNYKGDNKKFIGVIAQEVEHIPNAVEVIGGYKFVNYDVIGIPFIEER